MSAAAAMPLFEPGPDDPAVFAEVLRLVLAGRYARLDSGEVLCLSEEWSHADLRLAPGHAATIRQWAESGRVRPGAAVTARVDGEVFVAHLLIGPFVPEVEGS